MKILLSLSCGIIVATLPGFIDLSYNMAGLTVRAAGGAAAFLIVFFGAPSIPQLGLAPAKVSVNSVRLVDFRSLDGPDKDKLASSKMAITVPIEIRNSEQPSVVASLRKSTVNLPFNGKEIAFQWYYFVQLLPGNAGTWLTSEAQIRRSRPLELSPGKEVSEEVMHLSQDSPTWGEFIADLKQHQGEIDINVLLDVDSRIIPLSCKINPQKYRTAIVNLEQQLNRLPGYISAECIQ